MKMGEVSQGSLRDKNISESLYQTFLPKTSFLWISRLLSGVQLDAEG